MSEGAAGNGCKFPFETSISLLSSRANINARLYAPVADRDQENSPATYPIAEDLIKFNRP